MKRRSVVFLLILGSLALSRGASIGDDYGIVNEPVAGPEGYKDFVPCDPQLSPKVTFYDGSTGLETTKPWSTLSNGQIRGLLPNIRSNISVAKRTSSGELTYLIAKATAEAGDYRVVMDYSQWRPETVKEAASHKELGQIRVGVGMRMTADIHTFKSGINLGSVFALGVAASTSKLTGSLSVDIIGINSADVSNLVVTSAQIDETSIQRTLEAMAAIKAKLPENQTTLTPQVIAVKPTAPSITPADIRRLAM